ncbi:MAG: glutathione S-transferase [Pseudomonadales bacterium]
MGELILAESGRLPILYSFRRCPYAMRARMALAVAGIELELREILLKNKPRAMLDISPKGTVPVLVLPDGEVIDESLAVMKWALAQSDSDEIMDSESFDTLIAANDGGFKTHLDRYKYFERYTASERLESPIAHRNECEIYLARLEQALESAYLAGSRPGFSDMAIMPFIRQFANVEPIWFSALPLPRLQSWLSELLSSELFLSVMPKYRLWTEGARGEVVVF